MPPVPQVSRTYRGCPLAAHLTCLAVQACHQLRIFSICTCDAGYQHQAGQAGQAGLAGWPNRQSRQFGWLSRFVGIGCLTAIWDMLNHSCCESFSTRQGRQGSQGSQGRQDRHYRQAERTEQAGWAGQAGPTGQAGWHNYQSRQFGWLNRLVGIG